MRITTFISALCAAALARADPRTAQIYIQPLSSSTSPSSDAKPSRLAEISYDPHTSSSSTVVSYEAPDLPSSSDDDDGEDGDGTVLVRVGLYDTESARWLSGTTVASADNFAKGFSPNIILTVSGGGDVVGVACKGVRIDAGQTRDFGPKALVVVEARGKQPELNKPVVISTNGKQVEEQEKTFLQK
ncbi:hypothetical protein GMORB2_6411 [Geosmithia morbida]|uniref:Uncharacterized protein n=1 Tax=Geosmithia morbida TaxID=1094350 RepID=A0A9P5D5E6_9HYPO|nr:uncharacterized protein GMORB2_6411 [Geosmithia morbida]KAF4123710.1 hypothetical protein GMORB2_6411 [Geosmithia morbida]